jgi:hypothetical protein
VSSTSTAPTAVFIPRGRWGVDKQMPARRSEEEKEEEGSVPPGGRKEAVNIYVYIDKSNRRKKSGSDTTTYYSTFAFFSLLLALRDLFSLLDVNHIYQIPISSFYLIYLYTHIYNMLLL